jgi:hypothetical protein
MKDSIKSKTGRTTVHHGADHEIPLEFLGDGQLFFTVVRESHGELELLSISGAHSSTETNPEGIEFVLEVATVEGSPLELDRVLSAMDETTAERVRRILSMPLDELTANTMLLSDI